MNRMSPRLPLLWAVLTTFVVLAWSSRTAHAAPDTTELRVGIEVAGGEDPTHVCVVSSGDRNEKRVRLASLLDLERVCSATDGKCDVGTKLGSLDRLFVTTKNTKVRNERIEDVIRALAWEGNQHQCTYDAGMGCRPEFSLISVPDAGNAFITCARNRTSSAEAAGQGGNRALLVHLTTQRSFAGPHVESVTLTGRQLAITVGRTEGVDQLLRVLGGFYAPVGEIRIDGTGTPTLTIEPRCEWKNVEVPRGVTAQTLDFELGVEAVATGRSTVTSAPRKGKHEGCSDSEQDRGLRLLIPFAPRGKKVLKVTHEDGSQKRWQLETSWHGPRPPPGKMHIGVRRFAFKWRRDKCLYAGGDTCPDAMITASGVACTKGEINGDDCEYVCPGSSEPSKSPAKDPEVVDFPTKVTLTDPVQQSWTVEVNEMDQILDGYLAADDLAFVLSTEHWWANTRWDGPGRCEQLAEPRKSACLKKYRDESRHTKVKRALCPNRGAVYDDVFSIELLSRGDKPIDVHGMFACGDVSPNAREQSDEELESHLVRLPRGNCTDSVQYRYRGVRGYETASATVENGKLAIEHPMNTARVLHFSVAIMPASWQVVGTPASLQSGIQWAPMLEASLVLMPRLEHVRGWRFNIDTTTIGARRPILGLSPESGESRRRSSSSITYYVRSYLGFSFLSPWLGKHGQSRVGIAWAVGAGVQVGVGWPLYLKHLERLGGPDALAALRFDVRMRVWKHIEFVASPRLLLAEQAIGFTTDFHGQPTMQRSARMVALVLPAGGLAFVW